MKGLILHAKAPSKFPSNSKVSLQSRGIESIQGHIEDLSIPCVFPPSQKLRSRGKFRCQDKSTDLLKLTQAGLLMLKRTLVPMATVWLISKNIEEALKQRLITMQLQASSIKASNLLFHSSHIVFPLKLSSFKQLKNLLKR